MTVIWEQVVTSADDIETALAIYANRHRAEQRRTWEQAHPDRRKPYFARHKEPLTIEWTPPPAPPPNRIPNDFRVRLDARISVCPGCDQWQFDGNCRQCTNTINVRNAA